MHGVEGRTGRHRHGPNRASDPRAGERMVKVYNLIKTTVENVRKVVNHVRLLDDAKAGDLDHPHKSLDRVLHNEQGRIGCYGTNRWHEY
ncbi:unnamed protein product [Haemonchus placei]|uniref:Helitron helicase n=1 Tax=Haemonchus placei TaxID=6290 RepID=A0A0N4WAM7_HAEPC|nr:unnamed protein product [Haemonchus placei]